MSKPFVNSKNIELRYTNWLNAVVNLVKPKDFIGILGRGSAKTTDFLTDRLIHVKNDMPGSYIFFASDTYVHALSDMVPTLLDGLAQKGFLEGIDYVIDTATPNHFNKPYKKPTRWKHTITFRDGTHIRIVSMDQPSSMAGNSYQHGLGDEIKYINFEKIKKLFPAMRGGDYYKYSISPYYRGISFTTDMPNITDPKEYDWFLDREKDMNESQIYLLLEIGKIYNELIIQHCRNYDKYDAKKLKGIEKKIEYWEDKWRNIAKNSTLFVRASSFINADILKEGFFTDSLKALGIQEFKTSVLSLNVEMSEGDKFYINLGEHHFYDDGTIDNFYDKYSMLDKINPDSSELKYINKKFPIEAGLDWGAKMCSMVTGQTQGNYTYLLKEFYTLAPNHIEELAEDFLNYYRNHPNKHLILYYDRSGNSYSSVGKDVASDFKKNIEFGRNGYSTGWKVTLMSINQRNITQQEEFNFMRVVFGETNSKIPKVKIDKYKCKCLKSSATLAKLIQKKNSKGKIVVNKDKKNEQTLPLMRLPEFSTNFSDALKYYMSRNEWMKLVSNKASIPIGDVRTY